MKTIIKKTAITGLSILIAVQFTSCMVMHPIVHNNEHEKHYGMHDPVCGKQIEASSPYYFSYMEKTYYFDSEECKKVFERNPERFMQHVNHRHSINNTYIVLGGVAMVAMMVFMSGILWQVR